MKKTLIVTTVSGFVPQFEMNNVKILQSMGYEVHYAANYNMPVYTDDNSRLDGTGIIRHQIDFVRSPFHILQNIKAYHALCKVMGKEHFDLVHCHTPMGGVIARLAAKKTKTNSVFYTAHGFHFYKGAPLQNWLFYYPIEKWLARYTDVLLTINKEDYDRANRFRLKDKGRVEYILGPGLKTDRYQPKLMDCETKRKELNLPPEAFVITSVGELNKNKNQKVIIEALGKLNKKDIVYLLCGKGNQKDTLQTLSKQLGIENQIRFLGFRTDIPELLAVSNCFAFPSYREGLGMSAIEAMAAGLPIITSRNRGTLEYSEDGRTGYICEADSVQDFAQAINSLYKDPVKCKTYGEYNRRIAERYDIENTGTIMRKIYEKYLNTDNQE